MRYPCNYVCFPCRRTARVGFVAHARFYPPDPMCPGCGNKMISWRDKVPGGREKDWAAVEKRMVAAYCRDIPRQSPFHPEHWKLKYGSWDGRPSHSGLMGNPCAPTFFGLART